MTQNSTNKRNILAFAHRIKTLRKEAGYSLRELAKKAGITSSYLCKAEKGVLKKTPNEDKIRRIATALNISNDDTTMLLACSTTAPNLTLQKVFFKNELNAKKVTEFLQIAEKKDIPQDVWDGIIKIVQGPS